MPSQNSNKTVKEALSLFSRWRNQDPESFQQLALKCPFCTCPPGKYPVVLPDSACMSPPLWSILVCPSATLSPARITLDSADLLMICLLFDCPLKARTESLYLRVLSAWQRAWSLLSAQPTLTKTWNCSWWSWSYGHSMQCHLSHVWPYWLAVWKKITVVPWYYSTKFCLTKNVGVKEKSNNIEKNHRR